MNYIIKYFYGLGTGSGSNLVASKGNENLTTEFTYSKLTVDIGITGTILFLVALLCYCFTFIRGIKKCENDKWNAFYLCNAFCIVIWLTSGFFSPQIWGMKSVLFLWLMFGYGMSHFKN